MRKLLPFLLLANIIWSRPDGGVSITSGYKGDSRAEAAKMSAQNYVPSDWVPVAYDVEIPSNRLKRDKWKYDEVEGKVKEKDSVSTPIGSPRVDK